MELIILNALAAAKSELANDIMWVRDDLRGTILEQGKEIKRLQAVVWVLTQLGAERLGLPASELEARIAKALSQVGIDASV